MSDFNYRGKLPFRVVSSSVNTGYNAELTAAVGHNIEIVNQHRDEYGALQDAPLQGPFTEQWVGGNQHRHIDLNDGADNSSNRPEAFLISGSTDKVRVYGPTHFDINAPKALLTRDGASKSSVNLKNIRNESRRLGNFSHNYQVVQTSGRDINQSLIENNLTASGVLTTKFVKGVEEYSLPEEPNNKTVFVERFSAPGDWKESSRGALDRESEQYSPNNSLVTRNITVRQKYNSQLTQHSAQFNSGSTEGITVHAVNRNTIKNIELSGTTFVTASDYDNFWVQHAIPSTDLRYSWIAESVVDTGSVIQYQNPYDSQELVFNSSSFVVSGTNKQFPIDNNGINSLIKDKKSVDLVTNTFNVSSSVKLSASFSEIANSSYQYPSWRQIRTGEHPVARKLKENNIVSIEDTKSKVINGIQTVSKHSDTVLNYTEAPVTNKFKPLQQVLELKGNGQKYNFKFTHINNLSTFANKDIVDRLGIDEDSQQTYDLLRKYYSDPNRANDPQNPVSKLESYTYSETLYPREVNTYLAETRGRTQYILDQAGTASRDGYDIQLGTQRAFWRDRLEDRKRSNNGFYNSMNYYLNQRQITRAAYRTYEKDPEILGPINEPDGILEIFFDFDDSRIINFSSSINCIDNNNLKNNQVLFYPLHFLYDFSTVNDPETNYWTNRDLETLEETQNYIASNVITNNNIGELNQEIFIDYFYFFQEALYQGNETHIYNIPETGRGLIRTTNNSVLTQYNLTSSESYKNYPSISTHKELLPAPRPNYLAFLGGFESGSRNYSWGDPTDLTEYQVFNSKPTGYILSTLDSGLRYATESFGDKRPWFDSYDKYSLDIKNYAKDHSILPEFRVSSHMPYYVTEKGGNFRVKNSSFLELDGVGQDYRSSLTASNILYNQIFINSYTTTDILDNIAIQQENSNLTKLDSIKFSISGIKKLLPYNGFYPKDRTIQLANLFNQFLDTNVGGGYFRYVQGGSGNILGSDGLVKLEINLTQSSDIFAKNTVMPYYFAPGILYNTIKSGISVSFPGILADYEKLVGDTNKTAVTIANKAGIKLVGLTGSYLEDVINTRVNFETLIFPQNFIPIKYNLTSSMIQQSWLIGDEVEVAFNTFIQDCLLNIKFDANENPDSFKITSYRHIGNTWKETVPFAFMKSETLIDPSYSLAMSNFLAEIPRFFLKNGSMNVFRSAELKDWKTFELGKKYYFDLKMKKSPDLVMMEAYRSQYHITGTNELEKTFNGRYFGWPVSKVSGSRTEQDDNLIHNDPAYAPFTPPYFEGEATLRFELTPTSASYNTVKDLHNDIILTDIFDALGQAIDTGSEAYRNKMSIQDCMEAFGIGLNPITTFNNLNNTDNFQQLPDSSKEYWAISPKLETPVLDFSDQEFVEHTGSYWISSGYGRGMWSGYGKIPDGKKSITIELAESFPLKTGFRTNRLLDNLKTGSLLKQVGFKSETAKIGQLADKKTISEAVVMIPYVDKPIDGVTTQIDGHHFFAINPFIFDSQKKQVETNTLENGETSITKMIRLMKQYVIPPNFDFLKYYNNPNLQTIRDNREGIDPFVMYLFEFKHDLDQQDLADIWQGVMPKIATSAEHDIVEFGHKIGPLELFGENFTPPENLRWMVFKVKKKAEWNYFAITENISDDQNFVFKFANSEEARTPDYSYNWPYDYFSLVELAKIDISLRYDERPLVTGSLQTDININQFAIGNIADFRDIHSGTTTPRRRRVQGGSRRRNTKKTSGKKK